MREPQEGDRLVCPKCPWSAEVSMEDPDATGSEVWNHLFWGHAQRSDDATRGLMRQVTVEDRMGRIV